ncbi:cytochrome P450 71A1-like [Neltuma alba]|uniref:cytochrome P450 71A1-like n=1 Tax=Neltuma alba TaxID=207710 RepID=UPI0010A36E54|nr:cytochrome P450 71A1-like [Prosopis alba]XP_028785720.1 cytochrome P450 71A1-like [Prosopis alba]
MAAELPNQNLCLSMLSCLIFTMIIVFKLISNRGSNKLNLPPCPPKLPIIGNLHQMGTFSHRSLGSFSDKYGPLMLLQLGQIPTLVISSANIVREMVTNSDMAFSYRPLMTVAEIYFHGGKDVSFGPYGEDWRYKRKISVVEFLSLKKVRSFQFVREEEVSNLVNKIREACMKKNAPVNLVKMLNATTWNINFRCVFGRKYESLDDKSNRFGELVMKMLSHFREFSFGDYFPSLWWMDFVTGLVPKVKANFRELDAFVNHEIEQRKSEKRNTDEDKDFVDILVELQQDDDMPDIGLSLASIKTLIIM